MYLSFFAEIDNFEISRKVITAGKRSCGKVMFSQASMILFTREGGGSRSLSRGVSVPGGLHYWGVSIPGDLRPGGSLSGGVSVQGDLCLGGSLSRGSLSGGFSVMETPHTVRSGQYASYWNAFLFENNVHKIASQ